MAAEVKFFTEEVRLKVDLATQEAITELAFRIEERAKVNITLNDQVDTGAMLNGIYTVAPGLSTFGQAAAAARARNPAGETLDQVDLPGTDAPRAAVAGAMDYTIWQELRQSFLYQALVDAARDDVPGIVEGKLE